MMGKNDDSSFNSNNSEFIETLYEKYLKDPLSTDPSWRHYFESLKDASVLNRETINEQIKQLYREQTWQHTAIEQSYAGKNVSEMARKQGSVLRLIQAYRLLGHHRAAVDPIHLRGVPNIPDLGSSG